jgi:molecular chaperone DnaK
MVGPKPSSTRRAISSDPKTIGIDLGTYNSAAAMSVGRNQLVMVKSRTEGNKYEKNFPSFVQFDPDGKLQAIGKEAKAQRPINPRLVVWGVKRLVGLSYDAAEEKGELKRFEYEIEPGPRRSILIKVGEQRFTPSDVLAYILREIKDAAQDRHAIQCWAVE